MANEPTLDGIPSEIFEKIAEHLPKKSLKALRRASRDCASKILRTYTSALFSHQAYYVSLKDSLELALKVAQHPLFGPALRTSSFLVEEPANPYHAWHKSRGEIDYPGQEGFWRKVRTFNNNGENVAMLRGLFKALKGYGKFQKIRMVDRSTTKVRPLRKNSSIVNLKVGTWQGVHQYIAAVLSALQLSDTAISSFSAHGEDWWWSLNPMNLQPGKVDGRAFLLAKLEHLDLCIGSGMNARDNVAAHDLGKALMSAPALKTLRLVGMEQGGDVFGGTYQLCSGAYKLMQETYPGLESL